jgi:hypothetical protein
MAENDTMTETPEEAAGFAAMQNETPIELVEPDPEVKAEPEPKPEPETKAEPEPKKPVRLVPHEALHEERVKRQALERRLADFERAQQQPPPRQQQVAHQDGDIDENENPLGAIAMLKAKLKGWETQAAEVAQQQEEGRQIIARMTPRVEAYAREHPEYIDQFQYLRQSRMDELSLLGYAPEQIVQSIQAEEMDLARRTLANDLDPGDVVARLAKARGWRAKEPTPEPKKDNPAPDPEAGKKIERLQAGQRIAKSSSAGGGSGPEAEMTLERLASLDGAAFDAAFAKHGARLMS